MAAENQAVPAVVVEQLLEVEEDTGMSVHASDNFPVAAANNLPAGSGKCAVVGQLMWWAVTPKATGQAVQVLGCLAVQMSEPPGIDNPPRCVYSAREVETRRDRPAANDAGAVPQRPGPASGFPIP